MGEYDIVCYLITISQYGNPNKPTIGTWKLVVLKKFSFGHDSNCMEAPKKKTQDDPFLKGQLGVPLPTYPYGEIPI